MQKKPDEYQHIAFSVDDNFIEQAIVTLNSLFKNNSSNKFFVHILDGGLGVINRAKIWFYFKKKNVPYKRYFINHDEIRSAPVHGHVNLSSYNRIFLSEVISEEIDRVVYLDCDVLVLRDISPLFTISLDGFFAAAVPEVADDKTMQRLSLKSRNHYFNAGVLSINLKEWRSSSLIRKMIKFINEDQEKILFWDQDVLNYCFDDKWIRLDHRWNVTHFFFYPEQYRPEFFGLSGSDYDNIKNDIYIIHYTTRQKPWLPNCNHPLKELYIYYRNY